MLLKRAPDGPCQVLATNGHRTVDRTTRGAGEVVQRRMNASVIRSLWDRPTAYGGNEAETHLT